MKKTAKKKTKRIQKPKPSGKSVPRPRPQLVGAWDPDKGPIGLAAGFANMIFGRR